MKTQQHPKLKTQPRTLFSCGFFHHCTRSVLSPTTPHSSTSQPPPPSSSTPPPPQPPPPPKLLYPPPRKPSSSSSSSSSSTSQSFTQWRFPLPTSPLHNDNPPPISDPQPVFTPQSAPPSPPPIPSADLKEIFHIAELQLTSGSDSDQLAALHILERSLVPNPPSDPTCPPELMRALVANLKTKAGAKSATKILLALCLAEGNRHVAVEAGVGGAVVETVAELEEAAAERALAALELTCRVPEGAAEVRSHALAVPVMVSVMGRLAARGREYAISVLAVIYSSDGGDDSGEQVPPAPPEEVARAVVLAMQGDCTARGRRKAAQLLKTLQEYGRLDLSQVGT